MAKKKEFEGGSALERLKNRLSSIKGVYVSILSESEIATIENWYPTPSYDLNRIISGSIYKGIPEKSMVVLAGPEASFKTSMSVMAMVEAQKAGYTCVVIDTEGAWEKNFCARWGLDLSTVLHLYASWTDELLRIASDIRDSGDERLFIVVDSLGKLDRRKMYEDALAGDPKADQGLLQKDIKKVLKLFQDVVKIQKSNVFLTAHYYGNPNAMGYGVEVEKLGGGNYLRLAPDLILSFKRAKKFDDDKNVIGSLVKTIALKNRYNPPFQEAIVDIDYKHGVNKTAGMLKLAVDAGIVNQSGSWFSWNNERLGQGAANVLLPEAVLNELDEYIQKTGYSTVVEDIKLEYEKREKELEEKYTTKTEGESDDI